MEQHEKGFLEAVKQADFFVKDLNLGLFNPFKDVKDGIMLDEEGTIADDEAIDEGQGVVKQGDDACV